MRVAVWDTYVTKKDGSIMHFDIVAPSEIKDTILIHSYGKTFLEGKGQKGQPITSNECSFCHIEIAKGSWEDEINKKGFIIIEMENCI